MQIQEIGGIWVVSKKNDGLILGSLNRGLLSLSDEALADDVTLGLVSGVLLGIGAAL